MDGTFSTVPPMYNQLYTIHGLTENRTIPCVYVLLPNKQQQTYAYMFNQLLLLNPRLNPTSVMCDFEKAALNALTAVFPEATLKGCFFHLTQNIYRHIQSSGLQRQYQVHKHNSIHLYAMRNVKKLYPFIRRILMTSYSLAY